MRIQAPAKAVVPSWRRPLSRAWFELYLGWRFTFRDLPASWYPSMLFTIAA